MLFNEFNLSSSKSLAENFNVDDTAFNDHSEAGTKASSWLKCMQALNFLFDLKGLISLFSLLEPLSHQLQSSTIADVDSNHLVTHVLEHLKIFWNMFYKKQNRIIWSHPNNWEKGQMPPRNDDAAEAANITIREEFKRDPEKAYDKVPREELWYCMRKSQVDSIPTVRCAVGMTEGLRLDCIKDQL